MRALRSEEDPYFLKLGQGRYHLDKGIALVAVGRNQDAIAELKLVQAGPEYPRRQAYSDILQASTILHIFTMYRASMLKQRA